MGWPLGGGVVSFGAGKGGGGLPDGGRGLDVDFAELEGVVVAVVFAVFDAGVAGDGAGGDGGDACREGDEGEELHCEVLVLVFGLVEERRERRRRRDGCQW